MTKVSKAAAALRSNSSALPSLYRDIIRADEKSESSSLLLAIGMAERLSDVILANEVNDDGDVVGVLPFKLEELVTAKPTKLGKDGKRIDDDAKHRTFKDAACVQLLGCPEYDVSDKARIVLMLAIKRAIALRYEFGDAIPATVNYRAASGQMVRAFDKVEAFRFLTFTKEDGKLNAIGSNSFNTFAMAAVRKIKRATGPTQAEVVSFMESERCTLNGSLSPVFKQSPSKAVKLPTSLNFIDKVLVDRASDGKAFGTGVKPRAGNGGSSGKTLDLSGSIRMLGDWLGGIAKGEETDAAPTKEVEAAMDNIALLWADYRIKFPKEQGDLELN